MPRANMLSFFFFKQKTAYEINVGPVQKHWRFTGAISGEMREAAHRCELGSETPLGRTPSGLSLVTRAQHDQIRLYTLQLGIPKAQPLDDPGGEIFDDNVSLRHELLCQRYGFRLL